ncbi:hybrid sensor histidine kinase/response regulator [Pseudanabaena sp. FACHB-1277]|uniref:histidine kinase n=1 Tax=Pseudanabaena cinerea FACHB-1277 TaxID=2949581 RepID=A0A926UX82_9CYAN|nr:hybrid sensor histidine kinase/response regulator [Pseudanabaena cinerea]MBD2152536.1 hybrid sensor histidine kinase/response regulator [Pseudanabaena cinerea FACHB-1277]
MTNTFSILVVDDDPNNFDVIETFLDGQGYQLHYTASGKDAIAVLDACQPDLILLDVMMPEIDGIEVCKLIKASTKWHSIPIIMVTALNAKSDLANCLNAGADDFLSKPINSLELRARVNSMLRIKQQYDRIQSLSNVRANTINILEGTLNELRGNLASKMSHELNTPLNGIIGTIDLLNDDLENMDLAEVREMLGWADESARRLEKLTKKFLTYLELEVAATNQNSFKFAHTKFEKALVESKLRSTASQVKRDHDLILELEEAEIAISENHLLTILQELFDNAVKFSPAGSIIKVSSQVKGRVFCLSVQDFGRGMTNEQVNHIGAFMQFERQTYEQQGAGLGLKIVTRIVELAKGQFSISSVCKDNTADIFKKGAKKAIHRIRCKC